MASHCSGCVSVHCCVCTLDGLIAEHKFWAWVTIICAWQRPDGQNIAINFFLGAVNSACGHYVCSLTILGHMSLPLSQAYLNVQNQQGINLYFILHCTCFHQQSYTEHIQFCHYFLSFMLFQPCLFLLLNTKDNILKNIGNQTDTGSHDFHSIFSSYHWSQWLIQTLWLPTISSLVFNRRKKLTQVLREVHDKIVIFWQTTPLKQYPAERTVQTS